jgi:hypothetical protein
MMELPRRYSTPQKGGPVRTHDSIPLALAHITLNGHGGQGFKLGLLSGSRLSDIITTLAVFGTRYEEKRWLAFLQNAVPGCTELEAQWLIGGKQF